MPKKKYIAGIDIGGTNTVAGLVDVEGHCKESIVFGTRDYEFLDDYIERICYNITSLIASQPDCELAGIGIGAPNAVYYTGEIVRPANLFWKDRHTGERIEIIPMVKMIGSHFPDLPIYITNDANTAALGEMCFGAAKGMRDFLVVTLGTGLGSGFVSNGELIYGHDGCAGELGHVIVEHDGRPCSCGNRGCLEKYASATGIRFTAMELLSDLSRDSLLRELPEEKLDARSIYEAAVKGDELALETFEITGRYLGYGLSMAVMITSPAAIFLFGGLASAENLIIEPAKRYMEQYLNRNFKDKVKILPSGIEKGYAAILGAAALVWQKIKENKF